MALRLSIDIAVIVDTDAVTETPSIYDTVLHIYAPSIHSIGVQINKEVNIKADISLF